MNKMLLILSLTTLFAHAETAPIKAKVYFKSPRDGEVVTSPVHIVMGLEGMKLRPAGEDPNDKTSGHHHLIIDEATVPLDQGIPQGKTQIIHYGKAQSESDVKLAPGPHTLTLQFADGAHRSYGPGLSSTIHIKVK